MRAETYAPKSRIWLLRLVGNRVGRFATSLCLLIVLVGWFYLAGVFDATNRDGSPAAAFFFAVILAYIVPVFHFITEQTQRAFDQLAPNLTADAETVARWRADIEARTSRAQLLPVAFGMLAWAAHTTLLIGPPQRVLQVVREDASSVTLLIAPLLVWVSMICVVTALVENAMLFRRLARRLRIDLADTSALTAFGRVAVMSTLALVGAQAAFPILWIEADRALVTSLPGLLTTALAMIALFILPIAPIRRVIADAKRDELGRIGKLLNGERDVLDRDGASDEVRITRLAPYLVYRREIASVNDWPFDSNIVSRLAFYLVIPPLTWLGAAFIDLAVERLL